MVARHPTAWLVTALGIVFLLLATGALFAGIASGSNRVDGVPLPTESAPPPRPQPSAVPVGIPLRTCSISSAAADPRLGALAASVIDVGTGEPLFDRGAATPASPANVQQLLTAATAISVLGSGAQFSTRVLDGATEGTIVLVGGGDPTLATTSDSVYGDAPLISTLATAAMASYTLKHPGKPVKNVIIDTTIWNAADNWDASWPASLRSNGYLGYVTPLMIDGDRADPTQPESPRGEDPVMRAAQAFAEAAKLQDVSFSIGTATGSTVLAEVRSQPVGTLVRQMLLGGDDSLAEALARLSSTEAGLGGSSASVGQVIPRALEGLGLDTTGLVVKDGSGESPQNAVPPLLITQLLSKAAANESELGALSAGMAVAGESGDLFDRFTGDNAVAAGKVAAVSGWITNERSLAGIVTAADGTALAFAFYGIGEVISRDTKEALDTLATAVHNCGNNLSNN
jgi:serine-type D-Ala-D-Ala carboxypeptidase/endopeptidase (penicillin-binding protein 4)